MTEVQTTQTKRPKFRSAIALIAAISVVTASGCSLLPKEDEEEVLPTITQPTISKKPEYTAKTETLETKVRGSGKLMSEKEETLFVAGDESDTQTSRVKDVYVKSGDTVTAGQLLVELDVSEVERDLRRKELEFRKQELTMIENLRKANELAPEKLEELKIDFELERTKLVELREQIANAKITAPFDGTVVKVHIEKGDSVKAYDEAVTVADLSMLTVAADITQDDLKKVAPGMEVIVDINSAGSHKGKVRRLPTKEKTQSGNGGYYGGYPNNRDGNGQQEQESVEQYLVVDLEAMPENLARGTPLSVQIIVDRKENVVTIPPSALRTYGGRNYVQVIDEKGAKREIDVEVGMQTPTQVEIVKGLSAGQKVVGR